MGSQETIRALRHPLPTSAIAIRIHRAVLSIRTAGHHPLVDWVTAYSGIASNKRAHQLARAKLLSARARTPTSYLPLELAHGGFHETFEARQVHTSQRRRYLSSQVNSLNFPSLSRHASPDSSPYLPSTPSQIRSTLRSHASQKDVPTNFSGPRVHPLPDTHYAFASFVKLPPSLHSPLSRSFNPLPSILNSH